MAKNSTSGCSALALVTVTAFVIYNAWQVLRFIQSPDLTGRTMVILQAAGVWLGIVVVGFLFINVAARTSDRRDRPALATLRAARPVRASIAPVRAVPARPTAGQPVRTLARDPLFPVYLHCSLTNYGLGLVPMLPQSYWTCSSAENQARYRALAGGRVTPIVLPLGFFGLYYILSSPASASEPEPDPADQAASSGVLPQDLGGKDLRLAIVYRAIMDEQHLERILPTPEPVKLELAALDPEGHADPKATREMYGAVYEFLYRADAALDEYIR